MTGEVIRIRATDEEGRSGEEIGQIEFGEAGHLRLLNADPESEERLSRIIKDTNARDTLRLKAPPPPGAERYSLYALDVDRTAAGLLDFMVRFLKEYHGLWVEKVTH